MAISTPIEILNSSQPMFNSIDRLVMKCAYASQNHFGRLCNEKVYESDLAVRLKTEGIANVATQVPVTVSFRSFSKTYFLDLVVAGIVYELKAERAILPAHESQAINYAALLSQNRIKLINFGGEKVVGKLLGTPFGDLDRHDLVFKGDRFRELTNTCSALMETTRTLFIELGGYLSSSLYNDALASLVNGERQHAGRLPITRDEIHMGTHVVQLHAKDCCFIVTSLPDKSVTCYQRHLQSLRESLPISGIQWINFHKRHVCFTTIS